MGQADKQECFPFVVGCWRSGTTLLRLMLDSHPDLAIPNESHFIPRFEAHWRLRRQAGRPPLHALANDLLRDHRFATWGIGEDEVKRTLLESSPETYSDAIRCVFGLYAQRQGKARYGDKTPSYVQCIPVLADMFPEARFVHIVRDGRDVALSILGLGFGPDSLERAALEWAMRVRRGRGSGRRLEPGRYLEVRYEALVEAPEEELSRICEFLGFRFHDVMLRYFDRANQMLETLEHPEWHQRESSPPLTRIRDWREQMRPDEVVAFEAISGDVLEQFGYETRVKRFSGSQYARARRAELSFQVERVRGRLSKMRSAVLS